MSDSDHEFDLGDDDAPPNLARESDLDFDLGDSSDHEVAPKKRRTRRMPTTATKLACLFLLVDGSCQETENMTHIWAKSVDCELHFGPETLCIAGVVFVLWHLARVADPPDDDVTATLRRQAVSKRRWTNNCFGYLQYRAEHVCLFRRHLPVDRDELGADKMPWHRWCDELRNASCNGETFPRLCVEHDTELPSDMFTVGPKHGELLVKHYTKVVHIVPITDRLRVKIVDQYPPVSAIRRFARRERLAAEGDAQQEPGNINYILALPSDCPDKPGSNRYFGKDTGNGNDAVQVFKQLKFSRHCKDTNKVDAALGDAIDCIFDSTDDQVQKQAAERRSKRKTAMTGVNMRRNALRLDAVGLNIERRSIEDLYHNHRDEVASAHFFQMGAPLTVKRCRAWFYKSCSFVAGCSTSFCLAYVWRTAARPWQIRHSPSCTLWFLWLAFSSRFLIGCSERCDRLQQTWALSLTCGLSPI